MHFICLFTCQKQYWDYPTSDDSVIAIFRCGCVFTPNIGWIKHMSIKTNVNEDNWKYIGIIDLTLNSSQINVYRYEGGPKGPNSLPIIELVSEWSNDSIDQEDPHNIMSPLLDQARKVIPAEKHHFTPIYLYGSDSYKRLPTDKPFKTIQKSCDILRSDKTFLSSKCDVHASFINGEEQAALSWIAGMYCHNRPELEVSGNESHNATTDLGVIDISTFNIHFGISNSCTSKKVDMLRFGFKTKGPGKRKFKSDYQQHFVDLETAAFDLVDYVKFKDLASCVPKGLSLESLQGTGNFPDCAVVSNDLIKPFEKLLDSMDPRNMNIGLLGGYGSPDETMERAMKVCESEPTGNVKNTDCLQAVTAYKVVHALNTRNITQWEEPVNWNLGRAFIYADIDSALSGKSSALYMGLHSNTGAPMKWTFGIDDDHVRIPMSGPQSDYGLVRSGLSLSIILLCLGAYYWKTRKGRIWPCIVWRRVKWTKVPEEPPVELDDYDIDPLEEVENPYIV